MTEINHHTHYQQPIQPMQRNEIQHMNEPYPSVPNNYCMLSIFILVQWLHFHRTLHSVIYLTIIIYLTNCGVGNTTI